MNFPNMDRQAQLLSLRQKLANLINLPGETRVFVSIFDQCWGRSDPSVMTDGSGVHVSVLVDDLYQTGPQTTLRELRRRVGVPPTALGEAPSTGKVVVALLVIGVSAAVILGLGGAGAFK